MVAGEIDEVMTSFNFPLQRPYTTAATHHDDYESYHSQEVLLGYLRMKNDDTILPSIQITHGRLTQGKKGITLEKYMSTYMKIHVHRTKQGTASQTRANVAAIYAPNIILKNLYHNN